MKVAVLVAPKKFEIREEKKPSVKAGEILVRNAFCGICEGDTHVYRGEGLDASFFASGYHFGHESTGMVEEVGNSVLKINSDDKVTLIGGGFAEYVTVPADLAVKLPSDVNMKWALREPISCAVAAGWRSRINLGDRVVIVGSGFMGLLMSLDLWRRMIKPHHSRMNKILKEQFGVKILYHTDGAVMEAIPDLIDMGIDILNPLQFSARGMDPHKLKEDYGSKLCFHGGIDVQTILPHSTPDEVKKIVNERIKVLGKDGGYILGPSHAIPGVSPKFECLFSKMTT